MVHGGWDARGSPVPLPAYPGVSPGLGPREGAGSPAAPLPAEKRGRAHTPRKAGAGFHQPAPPGAAAGGPAHSFPVPEGRASADLVDAEGAGLGFPLSNPRRDWAEEAGGSHFSPYKPPPGSGRAVPYLEALRWRPRGRSAERPRARSGQSAAAMAAARNRQARKRHCCLPHRPPPYIARESGPAPPRGQREPIAAASAEEQGVDWREVGRSPCFPVEGGAPGRGGRGGKRRGA